ncbi:MAG: hypothetical protein ACK463_20675, partial [Bradyrhizobium sp.]
IMARFSQALVAFAERWFPDAYVFVLIAVIAVAAGAITAIRTKTYASGNQRSANATRACENRAMMLSATGFRRLKVWSCVAFVINLIPFR